VRGMQRASKIFNRALLSVILYFLEFLAFNVLEFATFKDLRTLKRSAIFIAIRISALKVRISPRCLRRNPLFRVGSRRGSFGLRRQRQSDQGEQCTQWYEMTIIYSALTSRSFLRSYPSNPLKIKPLRAFAALSASASKNCNTVNLNGDIAGKTCRFNSRARGRGRTKEDEIRGIHLCKVVHIEQKHRGLHYAPRRASRRLHDRQQILQNASRLR